MYRGDSPTVLILGDGLLGSEIQNLTGWDLISRSKDGFDITRVDSIRNLDLGKYDVVINCIANTDTYSNDRQKHWLVNYEGVYHLIDHCNQTKTKLVQIGTDYMFTNNKNKNATEEDVPVHSEHWYSYTKLLADGLVQLLSKKYLICRCTHKPYPFPYEKAFVDRVGNFDYTHVIAGLIIKLIQANERGVYHVGTESKTVFQLARQSKSKVKPAFVPEGYPKDTSFSVEKLNKFLDNTN